MERNLTSFHKRTISFSFVRARTFDRARTFTRTFDRGFVRGDYNDLKYCRHLLLLWSGKNDDDFFISGEENIIEIFNVIISVYPH